MWAGISTGVWIENLKKVAEVFLFGLDAKIAICIQRCVVEFKTIVRRNGIQPQISANPTLRFVRIYLAGLNLLNRGGAKRPRRLGGVRSACRKMNVGCI